MLRPTLQYSCKLTSTLIAISGLLVAEGTLSVPPKTPKTESSNTESSERSGAPEGKSLDRRQGGRFSTPVATYDDVSLGDQGRLSHWATHTGGVILGSVLVVLFIVWGAMLAWVYCRISARQDAELVSQAAHAVAATAVEVAPQGADDATLTIVRMPTAGFVDVEKLGNASGFVPPPMVSAHSSPSLVFQVESQSTVHTAASESGSSCGTRFTAVTLRRCSSFIVAE